MDVTQPPIPNPAPPLPSAGQGGPPNALAGPGGGMPPPSPGGPQNALAGPGGMPGQAPMRMPTHEQLVDTAHKVGFVNATLRELLMKPDVSMKDVINGVGTLVAEQIMDVPTAVGYLKDLPTSPDQIKAWLTQHYANSTGTMRSIAGLLHHVGPPIPAPAGGAPPPMQ